MTRNLTFLYGGCLALALAPGPAVARMQPLQTYHAIALSSATIFIGMGVALWNNHRRTKMLAIQESLRDWGNHIRAEENKRNADRIEAKRKLQQQQEAQDLKGQGDKWAQQLSTAQTWEDVTTVLLDMHDKRRYRPFENIFTPEYEHHISVIVQEKRPAIINCILQKMTDELMPPDRLPGRSLDLFHTPLTDALSNYANWVHWDSPIRREVTETYNQTFTNSEQTFHKRLGLNYNTQWLNLLHKPWVDRLQGDMTTIISRFTKNLEDIERDCKKYQKIILQRSESILEDPNANSLCSRFGPFARSYQEQLAWYQTHKRESIDNRWMRRLLDYDQLAVESIKELVNNYIRALQPTFECYKDFKVNFITFKQRLPCLYVAAILNKCVHINVLESSALGIIMACLRTKPWSSKKKLIY